MEIEKTLKKIADVVAESNGREAEFLFRNTRRRENVDLRSEFHYFADRHTKYSLSRIGEFSKEMGRNVAHNHATVIHNKKKVKDFIAVDKEYSKRIKKLDRVIRTIVYQETSTQGRANRFKKEIVDIIYQDSDSDFVEMMYMLIKLQYLSEDKEALSEMIDYSIKNIKTNEGIHKTTQVNT
jgi:hypothetical protein